MIEIALFLLKNRLKLKSGNHFCGNLVILCQNRKMSQRQYIGPFSYMFLCSIIVLIFSGCDQSKQPGEGQLEDKEAVLYMDEIERDVNFANYGSGLKKANALDAYKESFTWISGQEAQGESQLWIKIQKFETHFELILTVVLSENTVFPDVYDPKFNSIDVADELDVKAIFTDNRSNQKFKLELNEAVSSKGEFEFSFLIKPSELKNVKSGLAHFTVDFESEFTSFFGANSGVKPFKAEIAFDYQVPIVYKSILYFKNLTLNEPTVRELLGDNDWDNSTPEAGILVKCNDHTVLYDYTKNSFTHSDSQSKEFYHTSENDFLKISVLDVDYGFNSNDLIRDTLVNLKQLENNDFVDLKMRYVDKLLLYTQFKGRVN